MSCLFTWSEQQRRLARNKSAPRSKRRWIFVSSNLDFTSRLYHHNVHHRSNSHLRYHKDPAKMSLLGKKFNGLFGTKPPHPPSGSKSTPSFFSRADPRLQRDQWHLSSSPVRRRPNLHPGSNGPCCHSSGTSRLSLPHPPPPILTVFHSESKEKKAD